MTDVSFLRGPFLYPAYSQLACASPRRESVITSYSIHYTKLYEVGFLKSVHSEVSKHPPWFIREAVTQARDRWQTLLDRMESPAADHKALLSDEIQALIQPGDRLLDLLLRRDLLVSYRREVASRLDEIFPGQEMRSLRHAMREIHGRLRDSRLFVALHMHAGDGNVHTNIPVHSDNYAMLQQADRIVDSYNFV